MLWCGVSDIRNLPRHTEASPGVHAAVTIAARLLLGFLVSVLLLMGVGFFGLDRIGVVRDTTETIVNHDIWAYRTLQGIVQTQVTVIDARRAAVIDFMMRAQHPGTPTGGGAPTIDADTAAARWKSVADKGASEIDHAIATTGAYEQAALAAGAIGRADSWHEITTLLQQAQAQYGVLGADSVSQFAAIARDDLTAVMAGEPKLVTDNIEFASILSRTEDALQTGSGAGEERIAELYQQSRLLLGAAVIVALIVSIAMAFSILRSIVRPLEAFIAFAERVGAGDLSGEPLKVGRDELGRLGATLNSMAESMRQVGRQSREITSTLNASAAQIRASTQQQAASVEQQLAALQETAATADEITHSGARIASRAQEVIQAAQASVQTSASGLRAVAEAARAMDAIRDQGEIVAANIVALSEKTQAIGEIIMTVNDISERSHLLALNAAIEAAAAGENGRSFAVVASELKVLADQAKEATLQVRSILGEIQRGINTSVMLTEEAVKRVAVGRERSDVTERTIEEITASVQESVQTFQQIVASTNQQQIGIEQVMGALQNIRQASQQTAAGTRELDVAAGNLADLSRQLMALGERYKT
jgi:methyl-accepting chemotaxis protein